MSGQVLADRLLPPMPAQFQDPFWYSSLQSFWLYFPCDPAVVESMLPELPEGQGLALARFEDLDDKALVSLDFQAYTSGWSSGLAFTREIEFNAYAYPRARAGAVPLMSWQSYLRGNDQTKTIGGYRLHVPCDNPVAVQAGQELYGEPKFLASFVYNLPQLNSPDVLTWSYACYETLPEDVPPGKSPPPDARLLDVSADLRSVASTTVAVSPLVEYGAVPTPDGPHLIQNQWNFFGGFTTWFLDADDASSVSVAYGPAYDKTRLREDAQLVIGSTPPIAAQAFTSAPVSSEERGVFPTPLS
jgi:hypothetical protein